MEAAALRNSLESDLFPETVADELRRVAAMLDYPTYILLTNITEEHYRGELSLPDRVEGNQVVSWKERIFVPDTGDLFGVRKLMPEVENSGDIDIPIRRKA